MGRYLELSNRVQSSSSRHVAIIDLESVDSWLPNKVGIKPYHQGKVIDIDRGGSQPARYILIRSKILVTLSIHGGRVWKPPRKQPQGWDVNNNGEDDGYGMMDDDGTVWVDGWTLGIRKKVFGYVGEFVQYLLIIMQMFELT